ncbi:MAG: hypothetical protein QNL91_05420 [Candidatus Krumholzibacteria bacterium]|nr:hypothetical protein [Candidatus Krumholzibacteria bacterium]
MQPGDKLAHCKIKGPEIKSPLGKGGMAEVHDKAIVNQSAEKSDIWLLTLEK